MRFIDSNIFVHHLARDARFHKRAGGIIFSIEREEACTSTLVVGQVCSYLKWRKHLDQLALFLEFVLGSPKLQKADTLFSDLAQALELRERHSLAWNLWDDLIIAAQMKRLGINEIYSNDADFDRIPGIRRIF